MTSRELPNYHAVDEAVEKHPGIRIAFIVLGLVLVAIIHIARWALTSPAVGG